MLITLCYSVLTWIQSRQRNEINSWVEDCCIKEKASLVYLRNDPPVDPKARRSRSCSRSDREVSLSRSESTHSNFSTPRKEPTSGTTGGRDRLIYGSSYSLRQTTDLCCNSNSIRWQRLLWEEDKSKVIALYPLQIVDLRDWTAFINTKILDLYDETSQDNQEQLRKFYILLEAEPGAVQRELYRKFCHFGKITAWKCGPDLALILLSDLNQLIDLMHIFRLGPIILEGGWRVFRLTTVTLEGTIGTLISRPEALTTSNGTLTPGDLQRLAAGIFENRDTPGSTPKASLSKDTSKHDIATIQECSPEEAEDDILKKLPNWYERSPKKKSATLSNAERQTVLGRKRVGSFCSGSLSSTKSSSLASLLLCSKSLSVDEDERVRRANILSPTSSGESSLTLKFKQKRQSFENLVGSPTGVLTQSGSRIQSPLTESIPSLPGGKPLEKSVSAFSSPKRSITGSSAMIKQTPKRLGKPPNILVLCQDAKKRGEIAGILKSMLASDRYAIYDIRWDQLGVGGWAEQTALLVLSGKIPDGDHLPVLLQFLGDGGRLLAWNCESPPFGPTASSSDSNNSSSVENRSSEQMKKASRKCVVTYGSSSSLTSTVLVSNSVWPAGRDGASLPEKFPRILETSDSEGYSRPLTASVFAKISGTNETAVILLDGGSLGGKAVLSRVCFEECKDEESSLALLSLLLSQHLGIDCTRIKTPEYTVGYLLGDHLKIKDFLASVPSVVQQSSLTVEFIPMGSQGSKPSHERFPVKTLECPQNFSTLDYYNNLTSKELGRLVIYTDVITSALNVFKGHSLKHGLVVIAGRQTAGRGRGRNVWLSPEGSVSFVVQLNIPLNSQIGRRLSLVQHIASLSVVLAIPTHKEIKLCVKWPNDIYIDAVKVGGNLVESRVDGNTATVILGIGVNVSNQHPTVSLNSVLKDGEKLTCESFVAKCLSKLESLLEMLEDGKLNEVLNLYMENWLHAEDVEGGSAVRVEVSGGNYAECRIVGIDEYGFLRVEDINTGHVFSVQPDGNSFDITNKLIAIKT